MKLLDDYLAIQAKIFEHFGYVEDWRVIPLFDARAYFWRLDGEGPGEVHHAETEEELKNEEGNYYVSEIYTQRHLPKWVYRAADHTMICTYGDSDANVLLQIFDNAKERP